MARVTFPITGDAAADQLLVDDPLALVIGMLLDQQVPMEWAFRGPAALSARLGGLDATRIAAMEPDDLVAAFRDKPALHRYPGSMAKRTQALCQVITDTYDGDAAKIWLRVRDPEVLFERLRALPGFGDEKAKILLAVLGKRFGRAPAGWEAYAEPFSDSTPRSVADVDSPEALERVRTWKRAQKAKGRAKSDP
ncbi:MAG: HhH-GPD-type base excision DNA repair protein [Acidimicrobiia bacterium]